MRITRWLWLFLFVVAFASFYCGKPPEPGTEKGQEKTGNETAREKIPDGSEPGTDRREVSSEKAPEAHKEPSAERPPTEGSPEKKEPSTEGRPEPPPTEQEELPPQEFPIELPLPDGGEGFRPDILPDRLPADRFPSDRLPPEGTTPEGGGDISITVPVGGASVTGTIGGVSFGTPQEAIYVGNLTGSGPGIAISDVSNMCRYITSTPPAPWALMVMSFSSAILPGTYKIGGGKLMVSFGSDQGSGPTQPNMASAGTVTITRNTVSSGGSVTGKFNLTFGSDTVSGLFNARPCSNTPTDGLPPTDGGPPPPPPDVDPPPPPPIDGGPPSCQTDSDCGSPGCQQMGSDCVEIQVQCVNGVCQGSGAVYPGKKCDPASGQCI